MSGELKYQQQLVEKPPPSLLGAMNPHMKLVVACSFLVVFFVDNPLAIAFVAAMAVIFCAVNLANPLRNVLFWVVLLGGFPTGIGLYLLSLKGGSVNWLHAAVTGFHWCVRFGVAAGTAMALSKSLSRRQMLYLGRRRFGPRGAAASVPMFFHTEQRLRAHAWHIRMAFASRGVQGVSTKLWYGLGSLIAVVFEEGEQLYRALMQRGLGGRSYRPYYETRWREIDTAGAFIVVLFLALVLSWELAWAPSTGAQPQAPGATTPSTGAGQVSLAPATSPP